MLHFVKSRLSFGLSKLRIILHNEGIVRAFDVKRAMHTQVRLSVK